MKELVLTGLASYLPRISVDNEHLAPLVPPLTVAEMDSVGVLSRGHAQADESAVAMAVQAAERSLKEARREPGELDFLIFVSWTTRRFVPDVAPRVQHALGAVHAMAFDICCACSGFIQALSIAHGYLQNPRYRVGLIVAADRSSEHMRPGSRATMIFGDAAAAAVVESNGASGIQLLDYELRTDGAQNDIMEIDAEGYLLPHIRQRDLNALAAKSMTEASHAVLGRMGSSVAEMDWIVPHSGSAGVQGMLHSSLSVPPERVLTTLPFQGNLAASAIPCSLRHFLDDGTLQTGDRVLATAVGLGWNYSAMVLRL